MTNGIGSEQAILVITIAIALTGFLIGIVLYGLFTNKPLLLVFAERNGKIVPWQKYQIQIIQVLFLIAAILFLSTAVSRLQSIVDQTKRGIETVRISSVYTQLLYTAMSIVMVFPLDRKWPSQVSPAK